MSLICRLAFLGVDVNTKRPSNSNCGSGSLSTMFEDRRSLSSTNLPATIWPTSLAGIGEYPGPTTKGWCRIGAETGENTIYSEVSLRRNWWGSDSARRHDNGFGGAKVRITDGTTRAGLPWEEDTWAKEECVEKPVPAVHKAEAWELKSWPGMPPSMADEELSVAWSRTLEFLDGSRRETDACSMANKALTAWTTAARNSGDGWAALPATAVDALCVEPATGCEELTGGCDEIANADELSVALVAKKAASWLLRVLRELRELDISCN